MIVEDGTIVANANSYMTVAEYKTYWLNRNETICDNDPDIEGALVVSTQYLDDNCFKGSIVSDSQSLSWPRSNAYDKEGRLIANTVIPQALKNALAEYAKRQLVESIAPDPSNSGDVTYQRDKLGSMETETHYQENSATTAKSFPLADNWLKGLTCNGGFGQVSRCY